MTLVDHFFTGILNALSTGSKRRSGSGLMLGRTVQTPVQSVAVPDDRRFEHLATFGKTGVGKTTFLLRLALQHMQAGQGFVFFDYHGDATEQLVRLASQFLESADRLVLLDLAHPTRSPGLNPLELRGSVDSAFARVSELTSILKARWQMNTFGPRTEELLRNTLFTLAVNRLTLLEAPLVLTDRAFRLQLVERLPNADIKHYWHERFEPLSEAMKATVREPLLNKITAFITEPACRHLLGQRVSTVRFADTMQEGAWVVVNLAKGILREHAHTLGNLVFACLQFDIFGRVTLPQNRRLPFTVMVDEVQNLAENDLVTLLAEGRKFKICLITANQFTEQISPELRAALLSAGTLICFRLSASDARVLAPELSIRDRRLFAERLTTLGRGEAVVRTNVEEAMQIRIPSLPIPPAGGAVAALRSLALERTTRERTAVEGEIEGRHVAARAVRGNEPPEDATTHEEDYATTDW
jgi:hypothetical protein